MRTDRTDARPGQGKRSEVYEARRESQIAFMRKPVPVCATKQESCAHVPAIYDVREAVFPYDRYTRKCTHV